MSINPRGSFVRDPEDHAIVQAVAEEKETDVVEYDSEGSEGSEGSAGSATITTTRRATPAPVKEGQRRVVQFNTDVPITPRFEREVPWRQRIQELRSLRWYQAIVMCVVACHTLVLILQLPTGNEKSYSTQPLVILDIIFTSLYTIEMVVFLWADGLKGKRAYFKTPSNYLYVSIVATGWVSIALFKVFPIKLAPFRLLPALVPLLNMQGVGEIEAVVMAMVRSTGMLLRIMLFLVCLMTAFSVIGEELFGGRFRYRCTTANTGEQILPERFCNTDSDCPGSFVCSYVGNPSYGFASFDHTGAAFLVIFQIMSMEGWILILDAMRRTQFNLLGYIYTGVIIFFVSSLVFNFFVAVITNFYSEVRQEQTSEEESENEAGGGLFIGSSFRRKRAEDSGANLLKSVASIGDESAEIVSSFSTRRSLSTEERAARCSTIQRRTIVMGRELGGSLGGVDSHDPAMSSESDVGAEGFDSSMYGSGFNRWKKEKKQRTLALALGRYDRWPKGTVRYATSGLFVVQKLVFSAGFDIFVTIWISAIFLIACTAHAGMPSLLEQVIYYTLIVAVAEMGIEIILKTIALANGWALFKSPFWGSEVLLFIGCMVQIIFSESPSIILLRPFYLIKILHQLGDRMKKVQRVMRTLQESGGTAAAVVFILGLVTVQFSIVASMIFGEHMHTDIKGALAGFDGLFYSMLSMFIVETGENWDEILYNAMRTEHGWVSPILFPIFYMLTNVIMLSLFIAITMLNFQLKENEKIEIQQEEYYSRLLKTGDKDKSHSTLSRSPTSGELVKNPSLLNVGTIRARPSEERRKIQEEMFSTKYDTITMAGTRRWRTKRSGSPPTPAGSAGSPKLTFSPAETEDNDSSELFRMMEDMFEKKADRNIGGMYDTLRKRAKTPDPHARMRSSTQENLDVEQERRYHSVGDRRKSARSALGDIFSPHEAPTSFDDTGLDTPTIRRRNAHAPTLSSIDMDADRPDGRKSITTLGFKRKAQTIRMEAPTDESSPQKSVGGKESPSSATKNLMSMFEDPDAIEPDSSSVKKSASSTSPSSHSKRHSRPGFHLSIDTEDTDGSAAGSKLLAYFEDPYAEPKSEDESSEGVDEKKKDDHSKLFCDGGEAPVASSSASKADSKDGKKDKSLMLPPLDSKSAKKRRIGASKLLAAFEIADEAPGAPFSTNSFKRKTRGCDVEESLISDVGGNAIDIAPPSKPSSPGGRALMSMFSDPEAESSSEKSNTTFEVKKDPKDRKDSLSASGDSSEGDRYDSLSGGPIFSRRKRPARLMDVFGNGRGDEDLSDDSLPPKPSAPHPSPEPTPQSSPRLSLVSSGHSLQGVAGRRKTLEPLEHLPSPRVAWGTSARESLADETKTPMASDKKTGKKKGEDSGPPTLSEIRLPGSRSSLRKGRIAPTSMFDSSSPRATTLFGETDDPESHAGSPVTLAPAHRAFHSTVSSTESSLLDDTGATGMIVDTPPRHSGRRGSRAPDSHTRRTSKGTCILPGVPVDARSSGGDDSEDFAVATDAFSIVTPDGRRISISSRGTRSSVHAGERTSPSGPKGGITFSRGSPKRSSVHSSPTSSPPMGCESPISGSGDGSAFDSSETSPTQTSPTQTSPTLRSSAVRRQNNLSLSGNTKEIAFLHDRIREMHDKDVMSISPRGPSSVVPEEMESESLEIDFHLEGLTPYTLHFSLSDAFRNTIAFIGAGAGGIGFDVRPDRSILCCYPKSYIRRLANHIVSSRVFEIMLIVVIIISCVLLIVVHPEDNNGESSQEKTLRMVGDFVILMVFTVEFILKIIACGLWWNPRAYFRNGYNAIDFSVLIMTWTAFVATYLVAGSPLLLCALVSSRPLRLLGKVPALQAVLSSLGSSAIYVICVLAIMTFTMLIFGAIGVQLFAGKFESCTDGSIENESACVGTFVNPFGIVAPRVWKLPDFSFDHIGSAIFVLLQISTLEGWLSVLWKGMIVSPVYAIFFVVFITLNVYFVMELLIGVLVDGYQMRQGMALMTDRQRAWIYLKRYMKDVRPLPVLNLEGQGRVKQFVYSERREQSILVVSIIDLAVLLSGYYGEPDELWWAINGFHTMCVIVYVIEATIRMLVMHKKEVFSERYDFVDITCVVILFITSLAEWILFVAEEHDAMLWMRALRFVVVLRIIILIPALKLLLDTVISSLPAVKNVLLLFSVVYFAYGAFSVYAFGNVKFQLYINENENFRSFMSSIAMLFRLNSGEWWNNVMFEAKISNPRCPSGHCGSQASTYFFISFYAICVFILLNVVVAIVLDGFSYWYQSTSSLVTPNEVNAFAEKWQSYDQKAIGMIHQDVLRPFILTLPWRLKLDFVWSKVSMDALLLELEEKTVGRGFVRFEDVMHTILLRCMGSDALPYDEARMRDEVLERLESDAAALRLLALLRGAVARFRFRQQRKKVLEDSSKSSSEREIVDTSEGEKGKETLQT